MATSFDHFTTSPASQSVRTDELFRTRMDTLQRRTDRTFRVLLILQ